MRVLLKLSTLVPLVLAAACGGDEDAADSDAAVPVEGSAEPDGDASGGETPTDAVGPAPGETGGSGGGATLTLANGETIEFSTVLCTLEPQMAGGSEILYTASSYGDPGLDVTQFGDVGPIIELSSISVYDGNFESLWEANSLLGSSVELTLDGSTIRGSGSFFQGEDFAGDTVEGEIVVNC